MAFGRLGFYSARQRASTGDQSKGFEVRRQCFDLTGAIEAPDGGSDRSVAGCTSQALGKISAVLAL